jgi:hypothetical protein
MGRGRRAGTLADLRTGRTQAGYTDAAIQTNLMLGAAFKLPLRQTEGLMASVIMLMDLTITAPDHTTVSRRAVNLPVIEPEQLPHGPLHVRHHRQIRIGPVDQRKPAGRGHRPDRLRKKSRSTVNSPILAYSVASIAWSEADGPTGPAEPRANSEGTPSCAVFFQA